jgi:hypothetical protein
MGKTLFDISNETGVKFLALQKRIQRKGLGSPGLHTPLSDAQMSVFTDNVKTRKKSMPFRTSAIERTKDNGQKTDIKQPTTDKDQGSKATDKKDNTAFYVNGGITLLSVLLTFNGLYLLCALPGVFLALMIAFFLLFSVWVACNNMKDDTSTAAMRRLLAIEIMLIPLHAYTFYNQLPHGWDYWPLVSVSVGLASLVPYVSYTAVESVKNFHAEI